MRSIGAAVAMVAGTILPALLGQGRVAAQGKDLEGVVNLNTAGAEILQLLPGIGPAKVRSIFGYRQKHPFRTVDELVRIKGIGRKMVRQLRSHLAVSGPTTASAIRGAPLPPLDLAPPPAPARKSNPPAPAPRAATAPGGQGGKGRPAASRAGDRGRRSLANHCARPP